MSGTRRNLFFGGDQTPDGHPLRLFAGAVLSPHPPHHCHSKPPFPPLVASSLRLLVRRRPRRSVPVLSLLQTGNSPGSAPIATPSACTPTLHRQATARLLSPLTAQRCSVRTQRCRETCAQRVRRATPAWHCRPAIMPTSCCSPPKPPSHGRRRRTAKGSWIRLW